MAIALIGQVVGAAEGILHLVDGEEKKIAQVANPDQLVIEALTPEAKQKVVAAIDHLAGDGKLGSALVAHLPAEFADLADDEEDLLNWLRLYRHIKADFADNGRLDQIGGHLGEIANLLHLPDQAAAAASGWAGNVFSRIKGLLSGGRK